MDAIALAALRSGRLEPWALVPLAVAWCTYLRGFLRLHAQTPERFPLWRLAGFTGGTAALVVAVASPLDAFAGLLLRVHMAQHLLLTMVAPPLLWLGAPAIPLLRGLPVAVSRGVLGPFLAAPGLRRAFRRLAHPAAGLVAFTAATWLWHVPALYELALRDPGWHRVEHASFLATALWLWFPVIEPWPSEAPRQRWLVVPILLLADVQNTLLSAILAFSDRVLYPSYASAPRLGGLSALADQSSAGALMWVGGSIAFLAPAAWRTVDLIGGGARLAAPGAARARGPERGVARPGRVFAATPRRAPLDLLAVPALGAALRSLGGRRAVQALLLLLAAALIADGLAGPSMAPMNLAGVLPWTHWRALVVVALLAFGNAFCMACPFMLPRELARRLLPARRAWPRWLRTKWLAAGLLALYLWAYEAFSLWDSPALTAAIALAYFAAAAAIDGIFRGASFCKYVCPIGQFQFVGSLVSPFEVRARSAELCASCTTRECLRGSARHRGCELDLLVPRKAGNLDCTFCLDCVRACPYDNVGLLATAPGAALLDDRPRSSIGRLGRRRDFAALALVFVFGAFANAAWMIGPIARALDRLAARLPHGSALGATAVASALALVVLPAGAMALCAWLSGRASGSAASPLAPWTRLAQALVPLGVGMWAAHLVFHLATGVATIGPVARRVANQAGIASVAPPDWSPAAPLLARGALLDLQVLALDLGLCLTLYLAWRIASERATGARQALAALAPWATLAVGLYAAGVWIFLQPMEMRGTMMMAH